MRLVDGDTTGLSHSAVMLANNTRDAGHPRPRGQAHAGGAAGLGGSRAPYATCLALPFLPPPWVGGAGTWPPLLALPPAATLVWRFVRQEPGAGTT